MEENIHRMKIYAEKNFKIYGNNELQVTAETTN